MRFPHRGWSLTADTFVRSDGQRAVLYTRVSAVYLANDGFWLRVSEATWLTRLAARFGLGGIR